MAKKRKAPSSSSSQPTPEQKPEQVVEEEKTSDEDEESEEESSSEEDELVSGSEEEEEEDDEEDEEEGADGESYKRETLLELLEPFGKSQIIDILKQAAEKDPKILSDIVRVVDSDPTHRKIFIHGLGWDTTSEQLLQEFKPFGEIEECKLITDKNTGRSKGYAFVSFKTRAAAKRALKVTHKKIGNRMASCHLAALGPAASGVTAEGRKIYVGNVAPHVNPEKLKSFFARFGEIEDGPFGMDPITNMFKGFAVFTYKSAEGYKKAMEEPVKVFDNCQLQCKKFVENQNKNNISGNTSVGITNPAVTDMNYGSLGMNAGNLVNAMDASRLLMAQNQGIGFGGNPMFAAAYNPVGLMAPGLSTPMAGMGGNYGMARYNPSMMSYGSSQAALQGFGITGQSSIGTSATAITASRPATSDVSTPSVYPSYFG